MKKNFNRVPDRILDKLDRSIEADFIVGVVQKFTETQIRAAALSHLRVHWKDDGVATPAETFLPSQSAGRFSTRNIEGREIKRTDLPMVTRVFSVQVPNFGDWGRGSHEVDWPRKVYQVEYEAPRSFQIGVELLSENTDEGERVFVLKFFIDAVFQKGTVGLEDELLYAINVLQENVGGADIYPADATRDDYLRTLYVNWEILPPGERDATVAQVLSKIRNPSEETKKRIAERYNLLARLRPKAFISGASGFVRYFGAQFEDDLVVFENVEYGNALYVMFEDWQVLSRQSRLDLLRGDTSKFVRIVHAGAWEAQLRHEVNSRSRT
ncbi:MAG: hypothetical protein JSU08_15230 [Acidobacteria bacterium]|nr:hypothetical protein [Acidobacteriota bacterium]